MTRKPKKRPLRVSRAKQTSNFRMRLEDWLRDCLSTEAEKGRVSDAHVARDALIAYFEAKGYKRPTTKLP